MPLAYDEGWTIPADAPFYPPLPAYYRQVRFQFVFFRANPAAVATFLPVPLEPDPGRPVRGRRPHGPVLHPLWPLRRGLCAAAMLIPWRAGLVLLPRAPHRPAGIAAGREVYGTPKVFAGITVEQTERVMYTAAAMAGRPVMTIASTMEVPCSPEEMVRPAPSWRLKLIPRADGPGPAIKQLMTAPRPSATCRSTPPFAAPGRSSSRPIRCADLTPLAPQAYESAYYLETSFAEGYAKIVHDYLAET